MEDRAIKHFIAAWDRIKSGDFFDEHNNHTFEYMLQNLWKTPHQHAIKIDIVKHLPSLFAKAKMLDTPPPFIYALISLKDKNINDTLITDAIIDFVKSNASETSTYNLLHLIQTMSEKSVQLDGFVAAITKNIKPTMAPDMLEALAHMITISHPQYVSSFLLAFMKFTNKTVLINFIKMGGRQVLLAFINIASSQEVNMIINKLK
jgi:hypothetical protein